MPKFLVMRAGDTQGIRVTKLVKVEHGCAQEARKIEDNDDLLATLADPKTFFVRHGKPNNFIPANKVVEAWVEN